MDSERKAQYILYFTLFQVLIGFGIVIPIMPSYVLSLGGTSFHQGALVAFWAGAQFMFAPVWGALSDRIGRRPVLLVGLAGYAFSFFVMAFAPHIWIAIGARFLGGLLSAATIPTAQAYIADISTHEQRGPRMAGMGAAMNMGFIFGPTTGTVIAYLLPNLSHQGFFSASGLIALVTWVTAFIMLPEPRKKESDQTQAKRPSVNGLQAVKMVLGGPESLLFLLAFGGTFGGSAMFSMLGLYMIDKMGADAALIGVAFTIQGFVGLIIQIFLVGRLSRAFGDEKPVHWALISGAVGFTILAFSTQFWHVTVSLVFLSFALSMIRPLVTAMVSKRTRMEQGLTMGIQNSFDALGRTLGPIWAGSIAYVAIGAPFISAAIVYLIFLAWTHTAWKRTSQTEESRLA